MSTDTSYYNTRDTLAQFFQKLKPFLSEKDRGHYTTLHAMAQSHLAALHEAAQKNNVAEQPALLIEG